MQNIMLLFALVAPDPLQPDLSNQLMESSSTEGYKVSEAYVHKTNAASTISPLSADSFGDAVSHYQGSTEFFVADISIPGNSALPVQLGRRFPIGDRRSRVSEYVGGFGDWDIDIPSINGTFAQSVGWRVGSASENSPLRCSSTLPPNTGNADFNAGDIWRGNYIDIPGEGKKLMLASQANGIPTLTTGGTYPWVTNDFWKVRCKSATANGYVGEAFIVRSPDGVDYHMDWVVRKSAPSMSKEVMLYYNMTETRKIEREQIFFLVTRVEDRYGNWVNYSYSGDRLQSITSNDGRSITLTYRPDGNVSSVLSSAGSWTYQYASSGALSGVTRPDGSRWTYQSTGGLQVATTPPLGFEDDIADCPAADPSYGQFKYTVGHPSGAKALFQFDIVRHGRHNVPRICIKPSQAHEYPVLSTYVDSFTLTRKDVTGPGLPPMTWLYTYGGVSPMGGYSVNCPSPGMFPCLSSKTNEITHPDGSVESREFGILYEQNEGQLLGYSLKSADNTVLVSKQYEYVSTTEVASYPFPSFAGHSLALNMDDISKRWLRPLKRTTTVQQGHQFLLTVNQFDVFSRPTQVTRSSAPAP